MKSPLLLPRLVSFLLLGLPALAAAQPFAANFVAAGLVPLSIPLAPIEKGKWDVTLSPAYFKAKTTASGSDDHAELSGYGAGGSVVYGFRPHFAVGFTGLAFSGKGTYSAGSNPPPGLGTSPFDTTTSGGIAALSLIWDHFQGNGFRFPVLLGLHYESMHDTFAFANGEERIELVSPGFQVGLSPQFDTGPLRWEPFLMVYYPFGHRKDSQNGVVLQNNIHSDAGGQPGLNLEYRPVNLSFFYALGVGKAQGTHVFSLRWKRSFGG